MNAPVGRLPCLSDGSLMPPHRCPACGSVALGYDTRTRRWRHQNTMRWKTLITANVPRVHCPTCGIRQVRVTWAENGSRFTEAFEACAIQVLKAVRSKVQAQGLTALSWDQVDRIMERTVSRRLSRRSLEALVTDPPQQGSTSRPVAPSGTCPI